MTIARDCRRANFRRLSFPVRLTLREHASLENGPVGMELTRRLRATGNQGSFSEGWMQGIRACRPFPRTGDPEQVRFVEISSYELNRQRQAIARQARRHGECGMTGHIERSPRLSHVGTLDLFRLVNSAGKIHRARAKQDVNFPQRDPLIPNVCWLIRTILVEFCNLANYLDQVLRSLLHAERRAAARFGLRAKSS